MLAKTVRNVSRWHGSDSVLQTTQNSKGHSHVLFYWVSGSVLEKNYLWGNTPVNGVLDVASSEWVMGRGVPCTNDWRAWGCMSSPAWSGTEPRPYTHLAYFEGYFAPICRWFMFVKQCYMSHLGAKAEVWGTIALPQRCITPAGYISTAFLLMLCVCQTMFCGMGCNHHPRRLSLAPLHGH